MYLEHTIQISQPVILQLYKGKLLNASALASSYDSASSAFSSDISISFSITMAVIFNPLDLLLQSINSNTPWLGWCSEQRYGCAAPLTLDRVIGYLQWFYGHVSCKRNILRQLPNNLHNNVFFFIPSSQHYGLILIDLVLLCRANYYVLSSNGKLAWIERICSKL